jgi:hypothetical protein
MPIALELTRLVREIGLALSSDDLACAWIHGAEIRNPAIIVAATLFEIPIFLSSVSARLLLVPRRR